MIDPLFTRFGSDDFRLIGPIVACGRCSDWQVEADPSAGLRKCEARIPRRRSNQSADRRQYSAHKRTNSLTCYGVRPENGVAGRRICVAP